MEVGDSPQQEQQRPKPRDPGGGGGHITPSSALTDKLLRPVRVSTHALAPAQSGGVVLLDVALQVSPDGQVRLDPVNVCLVPVETRGNKLQHSSRHSRFNHSDRLFLLLNAFM